MDLFTIDIHGAKVTYQSDVPLLQYFIKNKNFMEFYDAKVTNDFHDDNYMVIYYNSSNTVRPITFDNKKMIINYPFNKLNESIILYLGFHFLEKQFGEMGYCSCHSACIEKNGRATLFLGDAGAGKTSVAVNMCINNGYNLISNDMSLIGLDDKGELCILSGTKFMNLRLLSVKKNMPYLMYLFENGNQDEWTNKVSVMASDIGIKESFGTYPIDNVIWLHLDDREKMKVSNGNSWRNNFLLYQNTSSHIRGSSATFIDNRGYPIGYIPSMETEKTYYKRLELLNKINELDSYYYVTGSLSDITGFVDALEIDNKVRRREV